MKNQISSIYLSINTNNYCYDLYVKIREIIYKAEEIYKNNILKIKFNMNELNKIEKKSKEESKIILKALTFIKVFIYSDINFNQLYKLFTEQLNIKERFQNGKSGTSLCLYFIKTKPLTHHSKTSAS